MKRKLSQVLVGCSVLTLVGVVTAVLPSAESEPKVGPTELALEAISKMDVQPLDWPQWGGSPARNNTPAGKNIPTKWDVAEGENIKWSADLGSQTYGNAVVANGKVYVGTNNGAGHVKRYPARVDLGCLLCFDEQTGEFLWQHSSEKLPTGRVHDWPLQGICCAPYADGERLWYVSSRGEVVCLDTAGFHDGKNNGPYTEEPNENKDEADVIWKFNMMDDLQVSQHNMCSCSVTCAGDVLLVNTSNGLDESHINLPSPDAPSFIALDRNTGKVIWTDKSPGTNILHGQWSSPTYAVLGGQPQALFAGGDGWIYSFDPKGDGQGNSKMLWKFDCNPKTSEWKLGGRGTRNNIIATPVVYDGLVYVAVGQDPEHEEGLGHLWCIDPTKRGDVSEELAVDANGEPIPHQRIQAVNEANGEKTTPNPNSAAVWHYSQFDWDGDGEIADFMEEMHRSCGTVAIKDDILFIADFSGLFHCLDAKTGKVHWTYDMLSPAWGSPLIVEGRVYIGDEDGDISIFPLTTDPEEAFHEVDGELLPKLGVINMEESVYSTPIVANNVLFISNKSKLYAISPKD
ncbi:outer membrane biogenesis protein BamB [Symmachiella macrocystis]|uniref:Outer membrane biogenesis protein BamB n=1 Tax=Symmachiella macrocystis TaxID=2527985 RepID=A0A5C6BSJ8_9PLAN|nr:PQQ-binding-like beta-propeller repeat protein [Symmachiella macrocystis]TWU14702.1 outer membrane biogenesis protein BamB [Symmachiella macrocystis]